MNGHFQDVRKLILKGESSDSFAAHFGMHVKKDCNNDFRLQLIQSVFFKKDELSKGTNVDEYFDLCLMTRNFLTSKRVF